MDIARLAPRLHGLPIRDDQKSRGSIMSSSELPSIANLRPDFIWGVSTSSFQIEGATREDGRGPSIWDVYGQKGEIKNHDTGDVSCDHYHRYREDIALMKLLGVQAYRFSVAWPRVLPQGRGSVNEPGLAFYDRLIDGLLAADIEPWLCLYHWDLPQALEDLGGWMNREAVTWFVDYTTLIATRFGDRVKRFATFNEPSIFNLFSRSIGRQDGTSEGNLHRAIHHVNLAHGTAVDVIRENVPGASIGCIHNFQPCWPASVNEADAAAAEQTRPKRSPEWWRAECWHRPPVRRSLPGRRERPAMPRTRQAPMRCRGIRRP